MMNKHILSEIGPLQLKAVKQIHLQKLLTTMTYCSGSYIKKVYNILSEAFRRAKSNHLIIDNPAESLEIPKGKRNQKRRSLTEKERYYFLKTCEHHRAGLYLKTILYCGTRPGEAAALLVKDFDLKNKILTINKDLKQDGSIGEPKSTAGYRKIFIPERFVPELSAAFKGRSPFDHAFTNSSGGNLTINSIKQMWDSFIYHLNIKMGCKTFKGGLLPPLLVADDLVMYCLRHTYCTDLQAAGVPINVARELMGHSKIATTAEIYTHSSEESFSSAAESINELHKKRGII